MAFNNRSAKRDTYVRNFQVHGAIGVQDIVEETAVVVVASEFGLESSLVFQRGGGGGQLGLEVLGLRCTVGQSLVQLAHSIVVVDLLAVVVDHCLLLDVGLVQVVGARISAVFVRHFGKQRGRRLEKAGRCRKKAAERARKGRGGGGLASACAICQRSRILRVFAWVFVLILSAHKVRVMTQLYQFPSFVHGALSTKSVTCFG